MKQRACLILATVLAIVGLGVAFWVIDGRSMDSVKALVLPLSPLSPSRFSQREPVSPLPYSRSAPVAQSASGSSLASDVVNRSAVVGQRSEGSRSSGFAPDWNRTSDFMIGRVAVGIILPESNGVISPSVENWTSGEISFAEQEIGQALQWWAQKAQEQGIALEFVVPSSHPVVVETAYEPIQMIGLEAPHGEADIWVNDVMAHLGYDDPGMNYLERVARYDDDLRQAYQADWAFTIFVVDDSDDGRFAPGTWGDPGHAVIAWAMRPGPYTVINDRSAVALPADVSQLEEVIAHEIGHVFGAADEAWIDGSDCGTGSECTVEFGYLSIENQNCGRLPPSPPCGLDIDCVMRTGNLAYLCPYSAGQVGWYDSDSDGLSDPIDTVPQLTIIGHPSSPSPSRTLEYAAEIVDIPWSTTHPEYIPVSINTVSVQYQVGSTSGFWATAIPGDGDWDSSYEEGFKVWIPGNGTYTIYFRAINEVGHVSTITSHTVTINSSEPVYRNFLSLALRDY